MARRKMSEEQKQAARERMQARWAAKKAGEQPEDDQAGNLGVQDGVQDKVQEPGEVPTEPATSGNDSKAVAKALSSVEQVRGVIHFMTHKYPETIEARQALDALDEALARMGQLEGLIKN